MAELATQPPTQFPTGTTVQFTWPEDAVYTSGDGYALTWALAGASQLQAAGVAADGRWTVTLTASANVLPAGQYQWALLLSKGTGASLERYELARGVTTVELNPFAATAGNQQSQDEKELAALNAAIQARLTGDVSEYTIGDRSLKKIPLPELIKWRNAVQDRLARRARGGRFQQVKVSFGGFHA
jgi:hypothetical protein